MHLDHGDALGACGEDPCAPDPGGAALGGQLSYDNLTNAEHFANSLSTPEGSLDLYPNPVSGVLTVTFDSQEFTEAADFHIYSIHGVLVHAQKFGLDNRAGRIQYNASDLVPGMYIVQIRDQDRRYALKFVKAGL